MKALIPDQIRKLLRSDHCPVVLRWFAFRSGAGPLDEYHRSYFALAGPRQWWVAPLLTACWPVVAGLRSLSCVRRQGRTIREACGVGLTAQWWQLTWLAIRHNITTRSYLAYGLWNPGRRAKAGLYIQSHEMIRVARWAAGGRDKIIDDKYSFFVACGERGVPTVPVLVKFDPDGSELRHCDEPSFPLMDLYVKPTSTNVGRAVEWWRYDAGAGRWRREGSTVDADGLAVHARRQAAELGRPVIVQPRMENHPALRRLSTGSLVVLRVMTGRLPDAAPSHLMSYLQMPVGDAEVSQPQRGGIGADVDDNGILMAGITIDSFAATLDHHPDTGARFAGEALPFWRDMVDTALHAHDRFSEAFCVGWDVATTPRGPVIIEGNSPCGLELIQRIHHEPMGETIYPELFRAAVEVSKVSRGQGT